MRMIRLVGAGDEADDESNKEEEMLLPVQLLPLLSFVSELLLLLCCSWNRYSLLLLSTSKASNYGLHVLGHNGYRLTLSSVI